MHTQETSQFSRPRAKYFPDIASPPVAEEDGELHRSGAGSLSAVPERAPEADPRAGRTLVDDLIVPYHSHRSLAALAQLNDDGVHYLSIWFASMFPPVLIRVLVIGELGVVGGLVQQVAVQEGHSDWKAALRLMCYLAQAWDVFTRVFHVLEKKRVPLL